MNRWNRFKEDLKGLGIKNRVNYEHYDKLNLSFLTDTQLDKLQADINNENTKRGRD